MNYLSEVRQRNRAATSRTMSERKAFKPQDIQTASTSAGMIGTSFAHSARTSEAYGQFKHWVYVCVNAIAKRLAGQPVLAGEIAGASENPERRFPVARKSTLPEDLVKHAETGNIQVIEDHPVLDAFGQPNPVQSKFEFLYSSGINILLTGESYWVGGLNEDGDWEMWSVPTNIVMPKHEGGFFTSYELRFGHKSLPVPAENVARTYFPHPTDIRLSWAPLFSILKPAAIDEYIIDSQEQSFERGIHPNLILSVAKQKTSSGEISRPVLTGKQHRQLIQSVRELWNETVNAGDPAVIDGHIESIQKLNNTPQEMNWMESGQTIKPRIMQAFQVNPISVGEIVGANRAQATEAEKQICTQAVNPLAEGFSTTAQRWLGPVWETPKRLTVWIEKAEPVDLELDLKRWDTARKNDDVGRNEYRSHVLGIGDDEREFKGNQLFRSQGGMQVAIAVQGKLPPKLAARWYEMFFDLETKDATKLAGVDMAAELVTLPAIPPNGQQPPGQEQTPPPAQAPEQNENEGSDDEGSEERTTRMLLEFDQQLNDQHQFILRSTQALMLGVEDALADHSDFIKTLIRETKTEGVAQDGQPCESSTAGSA